MSSGFISGGTSDAPIERSDEWLSAQQEIEANIVKKQEASRAAATGRSLFETLEANKAAKQEAFEEANRLKNQFRSLDEDEIEFLDSVLESTRKEEERVKKETRVGLEAFRKQQEEADKKARDGSVGGAVEHALPVEDEENWGAGGKKRKRTKEKEALKGVKIRKSSTTVMIETESDPIPATKVSQKVQGKDGERARVPAQSALIKNLQEPKALPPVVKKPPAPAKGQLVNYGSDEDNDW